MTRDAERMHRRNLGRLDRQLAIVEDAGRTDAERKRASRWAAALAEKVGLIDRPVRCDFCRGRKRLERHHPDHDKPLHVAWLCSDCHEIANEMDGTPDEHRPRQAS